MPVYPPYIIFLYFTFIMAEKHICSLSFSGKTSTSILNKRWRLMLTKKIPPLSLLFHHPFTAALPQPCVQWSVACLLPNTTVCHRMKLKKAQQAACQSHTHGQKQCLHYTGNLTTRSENEAHTLCTDTQNDGSAFTDESYIIVSIKQLTEERCATAKGFIEKM